MANETKPEVFFLTEDFFDAALLGHVEINGIPRIAYSKAKMVEILTEQYHNSPLLEADDDPETMAIEYLEYNTWGAYVGEGTPLYIEDLNGTSRESIREELESYSDVIAGFEDEE